MKIGRTEKIWIAAVAIFYGLYNLPGVPPYGSVKGCLIHGAITVIGIWVAVYIGRHKAEKEYPLKEEDSLEE